MPKPNNQLPYSDDWIRMSYRSAADKSKQLQILADLNCCRVSRIVDIVEPKKKTNPEDELAMRLYRQGLGDREIGEHLGWKRWKVGEWRKKHGLPPNKKQAVNYEKVESLYDEGFSDPEISEMVGCSVISVGTWRRRNGLKPNRSTRRKRR